MWRLWLCVAAALGSARAAQGVETSFSGGYGISKTRSGQGACFNALTGLKTGDVRPYAYPLQPNVQLFSIAIPSFQGCRAVGVSVSVCEARGAGAEVQLQALTLARVRRVGDLSAPGRADILVFCG